MVEKEIVIYKCGSWSFVKIEKLLIALFFMFAINAGIAALIAAGNLK